MDNKDIAEWALKAKQTNKQKQKTPPQKKPKPFAAHPICPCRSSVTNYLIIIGQI